MKKIVTLIIFSMIPFFFLSCEDAPIVGPIVNGVIYWKQGEAHKYYANDTDTLYRATKRSLMKLGYTIYTDEPMENGYFIRAGSNDRFKVKIVYTEPYVSNLKIRVNFWGDKPYAELIYQEVDAQVGTIEFDENGNPTRKF